MQDKAKKVHMLHLDPQSNLAMCMGYSNPDELPYTMANLTKELIDETFSLKKEGYILNVESCDIIPTSI